MASTRSSSNLLTVVSGLHLIFTIASFAFLSFKVYHLECELSLIRGKVFSSEGDIKAAEVTPLSADSNNEELRRERNRRDDQQKLKSYTGDNLKAACVQKLLGDLQVSNCFSLVCSIFVQLLSDRVSRVAIFRSDISRWCVSVASVRVCVRDY